MPPVLPDTIETDDHLDSLLSTPYAETIELMRRLKGDIMVLGAGGKMGPTLSRMALNACRQADVPKTIYAVSRYSNPEQREELDNLGIKTISADLAETAAVAALPPAPNILFLAGRKFGAVGSEALTWIQNVIVPANVAQAFPNSRIVAFSTGCVYPLVDSGTGGTTELDPPAPIGEYANSCLGRERIFEYFSAAGGPEVLLYRLNYAIDLRYGVLHDIATRIFTGMPVDLTIDYVNIIWQGDANNRALLCLEQATRPPTVLNVTGRELLSVETLAIRLGELLGREVQFTGYPKGTCFLSNASRSQELFGLPSVSVEQMLRWTADWIMRGGRGLGKPTHFTVTDGQFLDEVLP